MSTYIVTAYRWGNTNNHQYHVYAGDDHGKASAMAENERNGRGGKYGVAVYQATEHGESIELLEYFGSMGEKEPTHNWRIDYLETLGHVLDDLINGDLSIPNAEPDERGITGMHRVELPVDPLLRAEVERHRSRYESMEAALQKARLEAEERAARIWCPICDRAPVYVVEYCASFYLVPRDHMSGEIEIDGLEGNWCPRCEQMHLTPPQIARNQHKLWVIRHKWATSELESK